MDVKTGNPGSANSTSQERLIESNKKPWVKPELYDLQASDTEGKSIYSPGESTVNEGAS